MIRKLPSDLTRSDLLDAIAEIDGGARHPFGGSTKYDVLHEGRRYAPKAVVGIAASRKLGGDVLPGSFKGGLGTQCFSVLGSLGFSIVSKGETRPFPEEVEPEDDCFEGAIITVQAVRYERDAIARKKCIEHFGTRCSVCGMDFASIYGPIGDGFVHVHYLVPLSEIREKYSVDPIKDLRPVCPNCHAMLHKRFPPYSIEELRNIVEKLAQRSVQV